MECLRFFSLTSCFAKPITSIMTSRRRLGCGRLGVSVGSVEGVGSGRLGVGRLVESMGRFGGGVVGGSGKANTLCLYNVLPHTHPPTLTLTKRTGQSCGSPKSSHQRSLEGKITLFTREK